MNTPAPRFVLLAAIDDSPAAELVLAQAAKTAGATPGTEIHLLHIPERFTPAPITSRTFDLDAGRRYLDAKAKQLRATVRAPVIAHLVEREAAHAILQIATSIDADLVIVGPHDKRGPERWLLGSVAQKVAQRAPCAVLVARTKPLDSVPAPEIEPPCPECLHVQRESHGRRLWCARHSEHHPHAHLHYEVPEGFGAGSSLIGGGEGS
jgi:nucleotide-binding universal stress UspA family protein